MASKLRPLYDKIYVGVEAWLLAREGRREAKKYARLIGPNPRVDAEYDTAIRGYWRQFRVATPKKYWFTLFANPNRAFSPKFIPDDLWFFRILPHFNNLIFAKAHQDKCLHSVLFPDIKRPETIVKNVAGVFYDDELHLLTHAQAVARCHDKGRILVKPSVGSGGGDNIRFFDSGALSDGDIEDIFRRYGRNFIIQKKMPQHADMARLNPASLNTVRAVTFLYNDQVYLLNAVLRIGSGDSEMDNTCQGGVVVHIGPDGRLDTLGVNKAWQYTDVLPNGIRLADVTVPSYERIVESVKRLAVRMGHYRIIGWDIAVTPEGEPMLIEFNILPMLSCQFSQPPFGELTDQVLEEVFGRRDKK